MKESTIYQMKQQLLQYIQHVEKSLMQLEQSARLGITGESVRAQALQDLLTQKGVFTEAELTTAIGEVIKKLNEPKSEEKAEEPKVELTTPTPEQVAQVEKSVVEEPKQ
jgi:hypothetical protein